MASAASQTFKSIKTGYLAIHDYFKTNRSDERKLQFSSKKGFDKVRGCDS